MFVVVRMAGARLSVTAGCSPDNRADGNAEVSLNRPPASIDPPAGPKRTISCPLSGDAGEGISALASSHVKARVLAVKLRTLGNSVIGPAVIFRPIQSAPGDRWKLFLASASALDSRSRSNPSSILTKRWSSQRTAKPGINPNLDENSYISHSLASAVHFSDHRPDMGWPTGFFAGLMDTKAA